MLTTTQNPAVADFLFDTGAAGFEKSVCASIEEIGVAVVRGLFDSAVVDAAAERIRRHAEHPAIAGVPGYAKVDHPKRLFSPYEVGGPLVDMILDERVIDIVETRMASECVLAETNVKIDEGVGYNYFPLHADFSPGWRKSASSDFVLSAEALQDPVGIGGAIYLHDTAEGAFSYCTGTHRLMGARGPDLGDYPAEERADILRRKVRVEGRAGDLVLFDDRGFHGPDQPSRAQRTVILVDYYRVETLGRTIVSPAAVWTDDLARLNERQLRVMGVGATAMVDPYASMRTRFKRNAMYGVANFLIENAYLWSHAKNKMKALLGR